MSVYVARSHRTGLITTRCLDNNNLNFSEYGGCSETSLAPSCCSAPCRCVAFPLILNQCFLLCKLHLLLLGLLLLQHLKLLVNSSGSVRSSPTAMKSLVLVLLGSLLSQRVHGSTSKRDNCKPFTASFCQGLGYTTSLYPSGALGYSLHQIGQMVASDCSPDIATLMCRTVIPECGSDSDSRKKPCRALCERVKTDCEAALRAKRLYWPSRLRCDALPESNCAQVGMTRHTVLASLQVFGVKQWQQIEVCADVKPDNAV